MPSAPCDRGAGHASAGAAQADALFASALQRSDRYGAAGCAARVAQAFGEHPETAVTRMRWARTTVAGVFGAVRPELARAA